MARLTYSVKVNGEAYQLLNGCIYYFEKREDADLKQEELLNKGYASTLFLERIMLNKTKLKEN